MTSNARAIQASNTACTLNGRSYQSAQQIARAAAKLLPPEVYLQKANGQFSVHTIIGHFLGCSLQQM